MKIFTPIALLPLLAACSASPYGETVSDVAPPPPESGVESFAQAACGNCHAVERGWLSPNPEAPAFIDIANRDGLTRETLATYLADAHNYPEAMDFDLTEKRVEELSDHIYALRAEKPDSGN